MDPNACADVAIQTWVRIESELTQQGFNEMSDEHKIQIFKEAMDVYQTALINKARYGDGGGQSGGTIGPKAEKPKSDVQCRECGTTLTVGEKKYCDDTGKPYLCYRCSHK